MQFTLSWLKKFLETDANLNEITKKLDELGLEVERIVDRSAELKSFIIAEIIDYKKHPNADKLNICEVYNGKENLQIICGAANVRKNMKAILAPIGSIIPSNNLTIKKAKIRDVESNGMLCSFKELMINSSEEGIIDLPKDAIIGQNFADYYGLNDPIVDIGITPNRGDCSGIYGIARDLAAAGIGKLKDIHIPEKYDFVENRELIQDYNLSEVGYFIEIKNLNNKESPIWLQNYIRALGAKPISALVDISNYLMYSFGQPLHVYDLDKISSKISIRNAKEKEKFISLDKKLYELTSKDIIVADDQKLLSLAGIIGGTEAEVTMDSKNILIESAHFNNEKISYSARFHKIDTKAKYRFERKIDKNFVKNACILFASLIKEICGGEIKNQYYAQSKLEEKYLDFNLSDIKNIGGIEIDYIKFERIINDLGFKISEKQDDNYKLLIPSWRNDILIKEDIVEELIRIYGYNKLPNTNFVAKNFVNNFSKNPRILLEKSRVLMAELGYDEIISWSFMSEEKSNFFVDIEPNMKLLNPISPELNYMRPNIIANLLSIIEKNQNRNIDNLSMFEIGPVFSNNFPNMEKTILSFIKTGNNLENNIYKDQRDIDIYDIKKPVEEILSLYGYDVFDIEYDYEIDRYYHKTRSINYKINGKNIAKIGEIDLFLLKKLSIKNRVVAAEIFLEDITPRILQKNKIIFSNYPIVEREFGFIIAKNIEAEKIVNSVKNIDNLINKIEISDIYIDENSLGKENKSITIKIWFLSQIKTLSEDELNNLSDKIIEKIENLGGKLRLNFAQDQN